MEQTMTVLTAVFTQLDDRDADPVTVPGLTTIEQEDLSSAYTDRIRPYWALTFAQPGGMARAGSWPGPVEYATPRRKGEPYIYLPQDRWALTQVTIEP